MDEINETNIETIEVPDAAASLLLAFGRCWAIDPGYAGIIIEALSAPNAMAAILDARARMQAQTQMAERDRDARADKKPYTVSGNTAIVPIVGAMAKRPFCGGMFGDEVSTVAVRRSLRAAATDKAVKQIMLLVESPGGEVSGAFDLADDVHKINAAIKPVDAYIEDIGASAAYLVASQARRVYANRNAVVGSVGVYTTLYDTSKQMEQRGVKVHVIKAGANKAIGVRGAPVTEAHIEKIQAEIDAIHNLFIGSVTRNRTLSALQLRDVSSANCYLGAESVEMGLVDEIVAFDDAVAVASSAKKTVYASVELSQTQEDASMAEETGESNVEIGAAVATDEPVADVVTTVAASETVSDSEGVTGDATLFTPSVLELAKVGKEYLTELGERATRLAIVALGDDGVAMKAVVEGIVAQQNRAAVMQLRALCTQYDKIANNAGMYDTERKTAAMPVDKTGLGADGMTRQQAIVADLVRTGAYDF